MMLQSLKASVGLVLLAAITNNSILMPACASSTTPYSTKEHGLQRRQARGLRKSKRGLMPKCRSGKGYSKYIGKLPNGVGPTLLGDWQFDEGVGTTVGDSTDNDNDGMFSVGTPEWIMGTGSSACPFAPDECDCTFLSFDASTQGEQVQVSRVDNDLEPTTISVEAWVKDDSPNQNGYILNKGLQDCVRASYGLYQNGLGLVFYIGVQSAQTGSASFISSPRADQSIIWDDMWHHVIGTFDGNFVRLYVDGVEIGSGTAATGEAIQYNLSGLAGPSNAHDDLNFGSYQGDTAGICNPPLDFTGEVSGIRIYDGAFTSTEAGELYDSFFPAYGSGSQKGSKKSSKKCGASKKKSTTEPVVIPTLVGYWGLDEGTGTTVSDSTANENDGTFVNAVEWVADTSGTCPFHDSSLDSEECPCTYLNFNEGIGGSSEHVLVPRIDDDLEPATISVEMWVKDDAPTTNGYILVKGIQGCNRGSYALYQNGGGLVFYIGTEPTSFISSPRANGLWDDMWHHVVGTYDGTTVCLYVDGVEVGSGTASGAAAIDYTTSGGNHNLYLGSWQGSCTIDFSGEIGEARIYNGALSAAEVAARYMSYPGVGP